MLNTDGEWTKDANGNWGFTLKNGSLLKSSIVTDPVKTVVNTITGQSQIIPEVKYYIDENGKMFTGFLTDNLGKTYYFKENASDDTGKMAKGLTSIGSDKYFFNYLDGSMVKGCIMQETEIGFMVFDKEGKLCKVATLLDSEMQYYYAAQQAAIMAGDYNTLVVLQEKYIPKIG